MLKLVLSAFLTLFLVPLRADTQTPTSGTYRVWLCANACSVSDSARAIASAVVVILDDSTAATDVARIALGALRPLFPNRATGQRDNACFRVLSAASRVGDEELFFGIQPAGTTQWEYDATQGFSLRVYASPDAGYILHWTNSGPVIAGEGWSYGWQAQVGLHRNAFFVARRIGAVNVAQCANH